MDRIIAPSSTANEATAATTHHLFPFDTFIIAIGDHLCPVLSADSSHFRYSLSPRCVVSPVAPCSPPTVPGPSVSVLSRTPRTASVATRGFETSFLVGVLKDCLAPPRSNAGIVTFFGGCCHRVPQKAKAWVVGVRVGFRAFWWWLRDRVVVGPSNAKHQRARQLAHRRFTVTRTRPQHPHSPPNEGVQDFLKQGGIGWWWLRS